MIDKPKTLIVIPVRDHRNEHPAVVQAILATGYDWLTIVACSHTDDFESFAGGQSHTLHTKERAMRAILLKVAKKAAELGYENIVTLDADGRNSQADIHLVVEKAEKSSCPCLIIGVRQPPENRARQHNRFLKPSASFWIRLECGVEVSDVESSFRLYPVKELLAQNLSPSGSSFEIESLVKLAWSGIQVETVPLSEHKSNAKKPAGGFTALSLTLLHSRLLLRRLLPWPHKKLTQQEPFLKKVYEALAQNPLRVLREICGEHTSPLWLAMAVWLGIFMGALPLLTIHTIAVIYVAHKLHLNKMAAVAASQFCMPPVVPVLCIQVGYYLRNGELLIDFSWQAWLLKIHDRLWEWLIGSLLLGPMLGLIGAAAMYMTANRLQRSKAKTPHKHSSTG